MHLRLNKILIGALMLTAQNALASGYEIPINIGGRAAGLSGIGTPYAQGSEALYFNPAGLAREKMAHDISVYATPLMAKFNQPGYESEDMWASPFGLMYGGSINEDWGWGIGFYTAAGAQSHYKNVSANTTNNLDENTNIAVGELALGVGYRFNDRFKLGVAYRVDFAKANFKTIGKDPNSGAILNVGVKDLTDTQFEGFKIGAQYKLGEKTLVGLTYRSPVFFSADGKYEGNVYAGANTLKVVENDATAHTVLPESITLGASSEAFDHWNIMGEYAWTQYSRVHDISVDGKLDFGSPAAVANHLSIVQNWKDQHNIRVAGEYVGYSWPIRFGYQWTSQVTASEWARGTFAPPAALHTFAVGTGAWLASGLKLDGGLNYTFGGGDNNMNENPGAAFLRNGNFDVEEYALNLELMYAF